MSDQLFACEAFEKEGGEQLCLFYISQPNQAWSRSHIHLKKFGQYDSINQKWSFSESEF